MNHKHLLYGAIVILVIIIIVMYFMHSSTWDKYMEGMWKSTDEFAEQSDIDVAWLYLGDKNSYHTRLGYLIMYGDDEVIFNKKFKMKIYPGISLINPITRKIDLIFDEPDDNIPEKLTMCIDLIEGKMILYDNEQVYLSVIKNNEDSEYGKNLNN